MSPDLFNLYSNVILRTIKELPGVSARGVNLKIENCEEFKMQINEKKTKTICFQSKVITPHFQKKLLVQLFKISNIFAR